jgi:hypothetical protein
MLSKSIDKNSGYAKTIRDNKTSFFGASETGLESKTIASLRILNTGWLGRLKKPDSLLEEDVFSKYNIEVLDS